MKPAHPYFGSKLSAAAAIWAALGDVPNYVEAFAGSAAVHFARPHKGKVVTLNEISGYITNFLRALAHDPEEVAAWASWPVNEIDMHARQAWLLRRGPALEKRLRADPEYFDAKAAGWWVWGQCIWIGPAWCNAKKREGRKRPAIGGSSGRPRTGVGINRRLPHLIGPHNLRKLGQTPHLQGSDGTGVGYGRGIFATGRREDLVAYFVALSMLLEPSRVRITCGDWRRVLTPAVTTSHGLTGILLDPPYSKSTGRKMDLYANDSGEIAAEVRAWAIEHGDNPHMRIALCGYEGEHDMPESWRVQAWRGTGGYGNQNEKNANAEKERIWFSPSCLQPAQQLSLL